MSELSQLPPDLPVPEDDGAADHLVGMALPSLNLPSTQGTGIDLATAAGDAHLRLRDALRLPTFEVEEMTLYRRLTLIAEAGRVVKAFYPVFPPDRDATQVLAWMRRSGR